MWKDVTDYGTNTGVYIIFKAGEAFQVDDRSISADFNTKNAPHYTNIGHTVSC
jgi:hypothetical protein